MRSRLALSRRLAGGALVATLALAACGGGSSDDASETTQPGEELPAVTAASDSDPTPRAVASGAGLVDLVGPDVAPTAEIETNGLPSVVLDDVTNGRKVNFRNLVPQEKPILLWMYAPH